MEEQEENLLQLSSKSQDSNTSVCFLPGVTKKAGPVQQHFLHGGDAPCYVPSDTVGVSHLQLLNT